MIRVGAPYLLQNTETEQYVAKPGSEHSYVQFGSEARLYNTKEEAEKERCGNERIISLWEILREILG